MAKNKTDFTDVDVYQFINEFVDNEQKKNDSVELIRFFESVIHEKARMWGPTIIGFGVYHYQYKSGHSGSAPILGFSPRKNAFSLYVFSDTERSQVVLPTLGKFKKTKGCIYINRLADINLEMLKILCEESIKYVDEKYGKLKK